VVVDPPASGPKNMAVDHALAACLAPGEAVLRIYRWSRPTVSFGRNEPARDRYDPAAGRSAGIEFVRRPTGGRAVLHDRELTYSVVLPLPKRGGLRPTYGLINRGLVEALCALGAPAAMAEEGGSPAGLDSGPCFDEPAPGEVTVAGRKLVGSAQARLEGVILQHGSLLLGPGQERLVTLGSMSAGPAAHEFGGNRENFGRIQAPVSLEEVLGQVPPWSHLVEAVISGLSGVTGGVWHRGELTESERVKTMEFAERYASEEWTWRR
jgi:lipoate-protein ligase A